MRTAEAIAQQGFTPVLAIKGSPEMRLGGFNSLAGRELAGFWNPPAAEAPPAAAEEAPAPELEAAEPAASDTESAAPDAAPSGAADTSDLDSLLADLGGSSDAAPAATEASSSAGTDDLDALLASLGAESAAQETPPAEGAVDSDLEKLLADLG
jgi:type VI secretion system protein ImpC